MAQARMERGNMVVFQVNLDEGFPVVVATVNFHVIKHVIGKVEFRPLEQGRHVERRVARALEEQAIAIVQRELLKIRAPGCFGKVRGSEKHAFLVVGPAVQRAHDVATCFAQIASECA